MSQKYSVGVMRTAVEEKEPDAFRHIVQMAVNKVEAELAEELPLQIDIFDFPGPHFVPVQGAYAPLQFLNLGLAEKLERRVNFLLVITEVDLSASALSYVLALPSQLTNVGVLSIKRLAPSFWGREADHSVTAERLATLMLHTLGHLLNLPHAEAKTNVMYDFKEVTALSNMHEIRPDQIAQIRRTIPVEAREEIAQKQKGRFAIRQLAENLPAIWHALLRANPLKLAVRMPTMLTAALSVDSILFFSAETWDVASTLSFTALILFSLVTISTATALLYRTFKLGPNQDRELGLAETTVVTIAATFLTLFVTMALIFLVFFGLTLFSSLTFFPTQLKQTWPTVDPAVRFPEQIKLSLFLGAMGVLSGSLGGRADSKRVIRQVLFLDEET